MLNPPWLHTLLETVLVVGWFCGALVDAFSLKIPRLSFFGKLCLLAWLCLNFDLLSTLFGILGFFVPLLILLLLAGLLNSYPAGRGLADIFRNIGAQFRKNQRS